MKFLKINPPAKQKPQVRINKGFKLNFTKKENALKLLEQEKAFKELGIEVF